jgi:hypothetical protein
VVGRIVGQRHGPHNDSTARVLDLAARVLLMPAAGYGEVASNYLPLGDPGAVPALRSQRPPGVVALLAATGNDGYVHTQKSVSAHTTRA